MASKKALWLPVIPGVDNLLPGGVFSVALSFGSPRLGVTQRSALWSSDFPREHFSEEMCPRDHPIDSPNSFVPCYKIANFGGKYQKSDFVKKKIGLNGVSEPCALLAGRRAKLILPKTVICGVTIAIAREDCT
ncbi:cobalt-precorrin 5A hydrolase [Candidatus Hakubella thermalkaliphila]|uniref:Cobalt-precorrin 5A hydrolase n=1 Tax=Candidatus Hakubella thermalkaliphila TaxID=2754717 RepID=A0A6V8PJD6_9ACTN|nr:cobalt-precorrin 5A hydrolase [Candidatus Hakubella thermalkaliphila]